MHWFDLHRGTLIASPTDLFFLCSRWFSNVVLLDRLDSMKSVFSLQLKPRVNIKLDRSVETFGSYEIDWRIFIAVQQITQQEFFSFSIIQWQRCTRRRRRRDDFDIYSSSHTLSMYSYHVVFLLYDELTKTMRKNSRNFDPKSDDSIERDYLMFEMPFVHWVKTIPIVVAVLVLQL